MKAQKSLILKIKVYLIKTNKSVICSKLKAQRIYLQSKAKQT